MNTYHPSTDLITEYTSGSLALSHSLCVATHIEQCSICRQKMSELNQIGGLYFEEQLPTAATGEHLDHLKSSVFDLLDSLVSKKDKDQSKGFQPSVNHKTTYAIPKSLRQFVDESYDKLSWRNVTPSFKIATLCMENGAEVTLTRIKAGGRVAHHKHSGNEITLVLEGSFSDESGIYKKGDFILRDSKDAHKPVVTKDAECICLTVLEGPVQFTGWFTRWLNPLLRKRHPIISG